ncbi:hypothetical protein IK112_01685 [Candidatus Saccharibacteria bacterium]|nr:hypothetical protein [Candidatus Saccharibacteria bacterium]
MGVSRAELKLEQAARAFSFGFQGKTVLDIGSSTGGFTEFALKSGAKKVIAVEKGTKQMAAPLRFDGCVELHEKTDIFDVVAAGKLKRGDEIEIEQPDVILADVSFVSLKKILTHVKKSIAGENTEYLVMLKPQFEARPEQLVKGVVKNEKIRREIIKEFEMWLKTKGFLILKKRDNEVVGKNGNRERFYYLKPSKF